jgi:membrane protease YdiL (CAAX protease family)
VPLIVLVNAFVGRRWGAGATVILCGFAIALFDLVAAADLVVAQIRHQALDPSRYAVDIGVIVTTVAASALLFRPTRAALARMIPIEPNHPVHILALVLVALLLGFQIATVFFTDTLAAAQDQPPAGLLDVVETELPFFVAAFAGVGIFIRRSLPLTAERLGVVRPAWWHLALAGAAIGVLFAVGTGSEVVSHALTPDVADRVDRTTEHIFGGLANPVGIATVAVLPGICEELLFRGALQPRIGIVLTAILFTSIHTQYGVSFVALAIFLLAIALGLIRKYVNTTASCVAHAGYNVLGGFGIPSAIFPLAVAVEVLLIAATGYALWRRRRVKVVANAGPEG